MKMEKNEEKEKEVDSFLKSAHESKKNRSNYEDWEMSPPSKFRKSNVMGIVIALGLAVLLVILFWLIKEMKGFKGASMGSIIDYKSDGSTSVGALKIDQGKYQAVFLTNGQVYFGKINASSTTYLELVDIYYLQVKPVLQQGDEGNQNANNNSQQQKTELSLVKLGNELHGPLDRMMINKDQVVFVEDLKDDSKVTDAIRRYQQGQNK
ncbi:MAG: hypothetical protein V1690_03510 [Candidatus Moraniibacteriota bacterium]